MSFWDNVKKFAQPYSEEDYDEYEDEEMDSFEEEQEERPARRRPPLFSTSADETPSFGSSKPTGTSAFSGNVVSMGNKQEVVLFHPANFNDTSKAADDLRSRKAVIVNMENVPHPGLSGKDEEHRHHADRCPPPVHHPACG